MLPPRWVRRVVIAPTVAVGLLVGLVSAPVVLLVACAISPLLPGRWRPLRFFWFLVVYAALELVALAKCAAHWLTSGLALVVASPLLALLLQLPGEALGVLALAAIPLRDRFALSRDPAVNYMLFATRG